MKSSRQSLILRGIFRQLVWLAIIAATILLWLFREPLQNRWLAREILTNDSPPPDVVKDVILNSPDPRAALLAAWNSRMIVHRESAMQCFSKVTSPLQPLAPELDAAVVSATLDPDLNVRESAFGILRERKDPRLAALASAQLHDPDSQVRLLGLDQFRIVSPEIGIPTVIPLIDDGSPLIVTTALHLVENWSGERFGAKFSEAISSPDEAAGNEKSAADRNERLVQAVQRAKAWWMQHQGEFSPAQRTAPAAAEAGPTTLPAGDFQLRALDGKTVRLSDFRGKIVLVNFWTTWCTACLSEIPSLIALHEKNKDKLAILGVCLDGVPDEDGDSGHAPASTGSSPSDQSTSLQTKVARVVKARGINYPILMDEHNTVGGRFNGGELPTTILLDAQGNIRRRFVGARSLVEFEAMVAEIINTKKQ